MPQRPLPKSRDFTLKYYEQKAIRPTPARFLSRMAAMVPDYDELDPALIIDETPAIVWPKLQVVGFSEIASTNEEALRLAREGAPGGTLVFAESQTAGKGRKGRLWISPPRTGLYFSLILRPERPRSCWPLLTHVAAVALACSLLELSEAGLIPRPLELELKWPNDVLLLGKKAAGILLETAGIGGAISAAVVGVGINVGRGGLPAGLQDQATSVSEAAGIAVPRRRVLVRFLYHIQRGYDLFVRGRDQEIIDQWKRLSRMWHDTPVWILENDHMHPAVTLGLTETGALMVRKQDGTVETILAGDVTIRRSARE